MRLSAMILLIVGAVGALVSRVKLRVAELVDTFPARSVWRTVTDFVPSSVRVKLLPLIFVQVLPPLRLYWLVAPDSSPVILTIPELVIPSVELIPVSLANAKVGAITVVSKVKLSVDELVDTFPAKSV